MNGNNRRSRMEHWKSIPCCLSIRSDKHDSGQHDNSYLHQDNKGLKKRIQSKNECGKKSRRSRKTSDKKLGSSEKIKLNKTNPNSNEMIGNSEMGSTNMTGDADKCESNKILDTKRAGTIEQPIEAIIPPVQVPPIKTSQSQINAKRRVVFSKKKESSDEKKRKTIKDKSKVVKKLTFDSDDSTLSIDQIFKLHDDGAISPIEYPKIEKNDNSEPQKMETSKQTELALTFSDPQNPRTTTEKNEPAKNEEKRNKLRAKLLLEKTSRQIRSRGVDEIEVEKSTVDEEEEAKKRRTLARALIATSPNEFTVTEAMLFIRELHPLLTFYTDTAGSIDACKNMGRKERKTKSKKGVNDEQKEVDKNECKKTLMEEIKSTLRSSIDRANLALSTTKNKLIAERVKKRVDQIETNIDEMFSKMREKVEQIFGNGSGSDSRLATIETYLFASVIGRQLVLHILEIRLKLEKCLTMQDGLIITLNYSPLIRALKEFDSMAKGKAIERFSAMILQDGHFTGEQFGAKGTSKLNILFIELLIVANNHAKLAENGGLTDTRKWDTKCFPQSGKFCTNRDRVQLVYEVGIRPSADGVPPVLKFPSSMDARAKEALAKRLKGQSLTLADRMTGVLENRYFDLLTRIDLKLLEDNDKMANWFKVQSPNDAAEKEVQQGVELVGQTIFLSEKAETSLLMLIARVSIFHIVRKDQMEPHNYPELNRYAKRTDSKLKGKKLPPASDSNSSKKFWTKQTLMDSFIERIAADAAVINAEMSYPNQWDLRREMIFVRLDADLDLLGPSLMSPNEDGSVSESQNIVDKPDSVEGTLDDKKKEADRSEDPSTSIPLAYPFKPSDSPPEKVLTFSLDFANDCILSLVELLASDYSDKKQIIEEAISSQNPGNLRAKQSNFIVNAYRTMLNAINRYRRASKYQQLRQKYSMVVHALFVELSDGRKHLQPTIQTLLGKEDMEQWRTHHERLLLFMFASVLSSNFMLMSDEANDILTKADQRREKQHERDRTLQNDTFRDDKIAPGKVKSPTVVHRLWIWQYTKILKMFDERVHAEVGVLKQLFHSHGHIVLIHFHEWTLRALKNVRVLVGGENGKDFESGDRFLQYRILKPFPMFNSDDVGEVLCSLQSTLHKSTDRPSNEFLIEWPKWMARMEVHIDQDGSLTGEFDWRDKLTANLATIIDDFLRALNYIGYKASTSILPASGKIALSNSPSSKQPLYQLVTIAKDPSDGIVKEAQIDEETEKCDARFPDAETEDSLIRMIYFQAGKRLAELCLLKCCSLANYKDNFSKMPEIIEPNIYSSEIKTIEHMLKTYVDQFGNEATRLLASFNEFIVESLRKLNMLNLLNEFIEWLEETAPKDLLIDDGLPVCKTINNPSDALQRSPSTLFK